MRRRAARAPDTRKSGVIGLEKLDQRLGRMRTKKRLKKNLLSSGKNSRMPKRAISVHMTDAEHVVERNRPERYPLDHTSPYSRHSAHKHAGA